MSSLRMIPLAPSTRCKGFLDETQATRCKRNKPLLEQLCNNRDGNQSRNKIAARNVCRSSGLTSSPFAERSNAIFMHNIYRT